MVPVARARAVDLTERGDGERLLLHLGERLRNARTEVLLDDTTHAAERDRARAVGKRPQRPLPFAGPVELDHREELSELRSGALQPPELAAELLGQRERACVLARVARRRRAVWSFDGRGGSRRRRELVSAAAQQLAPAIGMNVRRLGRLHEVDQQRHEAKRIVQMREVPCVRKELEPAARNEPMGGARVLDRDDRVALAPEDQERDRLGQVEAIARIDPLPPGIDDGPAACG